MAKKKTTYKTFQFYNPKNKMWVKSVGGKIAAAKKTKWADTPTR